MNADKILSLLKVISASLLSVFAPIQSVIATTFVIVILDLLSGILASIKRKEPITSAGFRRTITKLFVFEFVLIMGFIVEKYLMSGALPIIKLSSAFIGLTELTSILENLNEISGGSLLKPLIEKLGSVNDKKRL